MRGVICLGTVVIVSGGWTCPLAAQNATLINDSVVIGGDEAGETINLPRQFIPADGGLIIIDESGRQTRLFASDGDLIARLGGPGAGPGEYRTAVGAGADADRLWVIDLQGSRVVYFDRAGMPNGESRGYCPALMGCRVLSHADGTFVTVLPPSRGGSDTIQGLAPLTRVGAGVGPVDTIALLRADERRFSARLGDMRASSTQPIHTRSLIATSGNGTLVAIAQHEVNRGTGVLRVLMIPADGSTIDTLLWNYKPREVPAAWIESAVDSLVDGIYSVVGPTRPPVARGREVIRAAIEVPDAAPPVLSMHLTNQGTLWLAVDARGESTFWREIMRTGECRRTLETKGAHLVAVDGDRAWLLHQSELSAPRVIAYRITGEAVERPCDVLEMEAAGGDRGSYAAAAARRR